MMRFLARLCLAIAAALTTWATEWRADEQARLLRLARGTALVPHKARRDWRPVVFFLIATAAGLTAWSSSTTRALMPRGVPLVERVRMADPPGAFFDEWLGELEGRPAAELRGMRARAARHMLEEHPGGSRWSCPETYDRLAALNVLLEPGGG